MEGRDKGWRFKAFVGKGSYGMLSALLSFPPPFSFLHIQMRRHLKSIGGQHTLPSASADMHASQILPPLTDPYH